MEVGKSLRLWFLVSLSLEGLGFGVWCLGKDSLADRLSVILLFAWLLACLLLVDQPPGTGLSGVPTNGYLHELSEVSFIPPPSWFHFSIRICTWLIFQPWLDFFDQASAHFIKFLEGFYEIFPEMQYTDVSYDGKIWNPRTDVPSRLNFESFRSWLVLNRLIWQGNLLLGNIYLISVRSVLYISSR